ncbi:MAG TPA: YceI family protein, partial [Burkholderiaceae bacterium]|nr:YceI family protein [Burkholderiaceae bacterium]
SGLGHNHVLTAPRLQGWLQLPADAADPSALNPAQLARSRFALALRLDELQLDEPAQRARLGPAFASAPGAEAVAATRANLLGESMLEAARFPWLRVQSVQLLGERAQVLAEIELDWHGRQRRLLLPLALQSESGGQVLRVQGRMALRLTDFGIRPLSLLGGMLAVQDGIGVNLDLVLRPR